jgi:translation elongation factor EF-1beta
LLLPGDKGGTDAIEEELNKVKDVDRAEVIDVRLAFG